jgi:hypothetical protein
MIHEPALNQRDGPGRGCARRSGGSDGSRLFPGLGGDLFFSCCLDARGRRRSLLFHAYAERLTSLTAKLDDLSRIWLQTNGFRIVRHRFVELF